MKTILIPLAVICLLSASPVWAELNNATGNNYGFVMKPLQWHLEDRPEAEAAMQRGNYEVTVYANTNPTLSPQPTIPQWIEEMTKGAGAGMINTHGGATGHIVEAYPYTDPGKTKRDSILTVYQGIYGLVMPMYKEDVTWGIAIRYSALSAPTYVSFMAGIFHNQCCYGDQFPFIGNMAFACGPTGIIYKPESKENVKAFWESLQGLNGVEDTPAGQAMANAPQLTKIGGNDNTVLFPHPLAFSHASGTRVPDGGVLRVWFRTNCIMNTVTIPAMMIATGWDDILVQDAWYSDDNEITVELERDPDVVDGEGRLKISGGWAALSSGVVTLDGGNDYNVRFIVGDGPAADVSGFSVVAGIAEWRVGSEWHTDHYLVEGSPGPNGPWEAAAPPEPPGRPTHAVAVSGYGPYFRLIEVEEGVNARRIAHGRVREVEERLPLTHTLPSVAFMQEEFAKLKAEKKAGMSGQSGQLMGEGERMVVFTAGDSTTTDTYLADSWRWEGYTVSVVSVTGFPRGSNNEFQDYLRGAIADSAAAESFMAAMQRAIPRPVKGG